MAKLGAAWVRAVVLAHSSSVRRSKPIPLTDLRRTLLSHDGRLAAGIRGISERVDQPQKPKGTWTWLAVATIDPRDSLFFASSQEPKLWYGIGILYDRYGSLDHAEEAFSQVMQMQPDFEKANEIYFRLGIIYKQQQKYNQSLEVCRAVTKILYPVPGKEKL